MLLLVACKDKAKEPTPAVTKPSALLNADPVDRPKVVIDGPSITPTITNAITFAVPKDAPWWGEMSFACYASAIRLQPGAKPAEAFTKVSPLIEPALRAADIDLDKDFGAIGLWGCGEGACAYLALQLRDPDKLGVLLEKLVPGSTPKTVGKHHYTVEAPGATGPRTIHVQAVPIAWPAKLPTDIWSRDAARMTHVVFLTGLFGKTTEIEPLAALADAKTAAAKVANIEGVVSNSQGRCVFGEVGARPFRGDHSLEHARFAMVAPEGKGEPLGKLVGSMRSIDLEVELVLSPAPTEATVKKWIEEARQFVISAMAPVRAQFAGQGPMMDVMFEIGTLLGKSGFRHTLKDKSLTLSFRTDRITSDQLVLVESKLQLVMGTTP